jgi:hypothetical protein
LTAIDSLRKDQTMNFPRSAVVLAITALGIGALARPVSAQVVSTPYSIATNFSASSLSFERPSGATGATYYYSFLTFTPDTTDTYTLETIFPTAFNITSSDTYLALYDGGFDPLFPTNNLIAEDDDSGGSGLSQIIASLSAGGSYTVVTTTFEVQDTGSVTTSITGPIGGTIDITATSAPEPGSLALLGLVALPALSAIRRRRI